MRPGHAGEEVVGQTRDLSPVGPKQLGARIVDAQRRRLNGRGVHVRELRLDIRVLGENAPAPVADQDVQLPVFAQRPRRGLPLLEQRKQLGRIDVALAIDPVRARAGDRPPRRRRGGKHGEEQFSPPDAGPALSQARCRIPVRNHGLPFLSWLD